MGDASLGLSAEGCFVHKPVDVSSVKSFDIEQTPSKIRPDEAVSDPGIRMDVSFGPVLSAYGQFAASAIRVGSDHVQVESVDDGFAG